MFYECTKLEKAELPVFEYIGELKYMDYMFYGCENLSYITWGDSVAVIDSFAFGGCAFTELQLPATLRVIRCGGFNGYYDGTITRVTFSAPIDTIELEAFSGQDIVTMRFENMVPPVTTGTEYGGCFYNAIVDSLIVPCGSKNAWLSDAFWGQFADQYHEACDAISDVERPNVKVYSIDGRIVIEGADGETVHVFDMMGRTIHNEALPTGIYLVKVGDHSARKVAVIR